MPSRFASGEWRAWGSRSGAPCRDRRPPRPPSRASRSSRAPSSLRRMSAADPRTARTPAEPWRQGPRGRSWCAWRHETAGIPVAGARRPQSIGPCAPRCIIGRCMTRAVTSNPRDLGDAVNVNNCSRREFLGMSAAAAGASFAAHTIVPTPHSPADGVAMVDAAKKTGRIVQIGSQRVSSQICAKARELIAQGTLGDLMLVEGWLGRNDPTGAWQYPPPPDLSPRTLDWDTWQGTVPKRAFDPYLFARWRCWKEYGTGVAGDLLVHLISGMMFMLGINEPPKQASAVGGIRRWKDGRNMPDVHAVVYYFGDLPVYMRLNLGTEMPEAYRIQGSKGVLDVTGSTLSLAPQTGKDNYPSYYTGSYPHAMREAYLQKWHEENDPKLGQATAMPETISFSGPDFDDVRPHLWTFFEAVRTRKPVVEDVVFGHNAALACHMANESYFRKSTVSWDEASKTIKGG